LKTELIRWVSTVASVSYAIKALEGPDVTEKATPSACVAVGTSEADPLGGIFSDYQKCNTLTNKFVIHAMTLTVRLPIAMESQLSQLCDSLGLSKSQVVQSALRDWFAKPAAVQSHPLMAFVETAARSEPSSEWAGPYSKEALRQRVLSGTAVHQVAEPVAIYGVRESDPAAKPAVSEKAGQRRSAKTTTRAKSKSA